MSYGSKLFWHFVRLQFNEFSQSNSHSSVIHEIQLKERAHITIDLIMRVIVKISFFSTVQRGGGAAQPAELMRFRIS